ncbi:unnamed protein product [Musa acuminata subsp. malaccensis]|uniref:(wild Malaysian banana) hypothetical protein n=1 Tax=Musa acuminata subsp. malaccensis TaxID=214687 RepID=A0A8D7FJF9_MUSAM|nr:unnamed protein product [Musa acuminata subsp. malaccensis]
MEGNKIHTVGRTRGSKITPCDLPKNTKKLLFLLCFFDLPCERTQHGKGRCDKRIDGLNMSLIYLTLDGDFRLCRCSTSERTPY